MAERFTGLPKLTWMRMRCAAELLPTEAKIEGISREVGDQNPFDISTTFNRVMG